MTSAIVEQLQTIPRIKRVAIALITDGSGDCSAYSVKVAGLVIGYAYDRGNLDNATGTIVRAAPSYLIARGSGVRQEGSAYPLPATATFALLGNSGVVPVFGVALRTLVD